MTGEAPAFVAATLVAPDEPKTVAELCGELLRDCLAEFETPASLQDHEQVHALRVATKRLRSAWHLVQDEVGKKAARKRRRSLRKLSARLSHRRDTDVLGTLARQLAAVAQGPDGETARLLDQVGQQLHRQRRSSDSFSRTGPDALFQEVRRCLETEAVAWKELRQNDPARTRQAVRRTLRRSVDRACRRTRQALQNGDAETWHEWRKAIKRLRYQREFVAAAGGRAPGKFDARISRLGTALGQRNDLSNLRAHVEDRGKSGARLEEKDRKKLEKAIAHAEIDLLRNCRRLGRRLIREKR